MRRYINGSKPDAAKWPANFPGATWFAECATPMPLRETTFYDDHPFDWTEGFSCSELEDTLAPPLAAFIKAIPAGAAVLDLGCGPGRVMSCLAVRGLWAVGLDLSLASVRLMMQRTGKPGVVGNGMQLPFADGTMDRVIADGVIHHTPNPFAAFAEGCRVLKPGGSFYLAVYKPGGALPEALRFSGRGDSQPGRAPRRQSAGSRYVSAALLSGPPGEIARQEILGGSEESFLRLLRHAPGGIHFPGSGGAVVQEVRRPGCRL